MKGLDLPEHCATCVILLAGTLMGTPAMAQTFQVDVGYAALQALLGAGTPNAAGVPIIHAEASLVLPTDPTYPIYAPDTANASFAGKSFTVPGTPSTAPSPHGTGVGLLLYGSGALAQGITTIAVYEADEWLQGLATSRAVAPLSGARVANDSWVGAGNTPADTGTMLRLMDRQTAVNQLIQVVGMPYGAGYPLAAGGYNVIAVGETAASNFYGSDAVDTVYVAGRTRPDVVAPISSTSGAAPLVAAAAALLVQTGHAGGTSLSSGSNSVAGVGTVYDAERAATIKAALMAGADRTTNNSFTTANITNYGGANQTGNGLDRRYGAGQLNVFNSYRIVAGGEQHSLENGGIGIGSRGFDYAAFGGATGSHATATYPFSVGTNSFISICLAWNLGVANDATLATTRHTLNLVLFDVTTQSAIASSASALDPTQNIWAPLLQHHGYQILIQSGESGNFSWDYALAWNVIAAPPVTPTAASVNAGEQTTLSVTPLGSGPYNYQWYQGFAGDESNPIAGAVGASFTTPALGATTNYWVQITTASHIIENSTTIKISVTASAAADAPLPPWSLGVLGVSLIAIAARRRAVAAR